ncbi:MAG TPA: glycosyltransferase [Candidatus Saccharimonadales bacterium]|nr:glycosyltransferase [Candidatus Saccharimonadales bacterium]
MTKRVKPRVSFVMPAYNRAYIIKSAVQSIINQTRTDWELLIIDDGSTDDTEAVVRAIGDKRIRYYTQENQGPAAARNKGVSLAQGKWIAYLDSDNELLPQFMDRMLAWLDVHPEAVFAVPRARRTQELYQDGALVKVIDDSKDTPPGLSLKDIFMKKQHLDANGFTHLRSLFDDSSIRWDGNLHGLEDWELALTIGERYPSGFLYVEEVLYCYHQRFGGDGIVSNSTYSDWAEYFEYIYHKHKHDTMLEGQSWYPSRIEKWQGLQAQFEAGKLPPYHRYFFEVETT